MVTNTLRGWLTETSTGFGRHYKVFHALEKELIKNPKGSLDCLVVGPGLELHHANPVKKPNGEWALVEKASSSKRYINSYQVFELANAARNAGIEDYYITALDINPDVLDEMRKRPALIRFYRDFWEKCHHIHASLEEMDEMQQYFESFFRSNTLYAEGGERIVEIPDDVLSRVHLHEGDILADELPPESYDIVVCTVVLSHYSRECTHGVDHVPEVMEKLCNAVKPGGFHINSELVFPGDWEHIAYSPGRSTTMHQQYAHMMQKG
ncbi:hypothetical protein JW707_02305 [Candidatus Woesearchaeota archaeon]|nr:hypothetical protein [Candidatus Woesearchaeota archaeon]